MAEETEGYKPVWGGWEDLLHMEPESEATPALSPTLSPRRGRSFFRRSRNDSFFQVVSTLHLFRI
jgi:hypothetical protein